MKKYLVTLMLPILLATQMAWAKSKFETEIKRVDTPIPQQAQQAVSMLPENMQRDLMQAAELVRQHQGENALPALNKLIKQSDTELRKRKNVRASGNRVHTLLLLTEAANSKKSTEVISAEWLLPRYLRAFVYMEQKNYAAAAKDLDAVLKVAPYEPRFLNERGQVANAQKDFATSERIFKQLSEAAKMLPDEQQSIYFQGIALRGLGYAAIEREQWQVAEQYYRQALKINPNDRTAKNELAFILKNRK